MFYQNKFPIYRNTTQLTLGIENIVGVCSHYREHTIGSEMHLNTYAFVSKQTRLYSQPFKTATNSTNFYH